MKLQRLQFLQGAQVLNLQIPYKEMRYSHITPKRVSKRWTSCPPLWRSLWKGVSIKFSKLYLIDPVPFHLATPHPHIPSLSTCRIRFWLRFSRFNSTSASKPSIFAILLSERSSSTILMQASRHDMDGKPMQAHMKILESMIPWQPCCHAGIQ